MRAVIQWVVITLAVIGAIGVVMAIWEEIGPRIRRDGRDFGDELELDDVRGAAAELGAELDWWQMSVEALEAQPAFQRAVAALADDGRGQALSPGSRATRARQRSRVPDGSARSGSRRRLRPLRRRAIRPVESSRVKVEIFYCPT